MKIMAFRFMDASYARLVTATLETVASNNIELDSDFQQTSLNARNVMKDVERKNWGVTLSRLRT